MSSKEQSGRYQLFQNLLSNFLNLLTDYPTVEAIDGDVNQ